MYPISVISDEFKLGDSIDAFEQICKTLCEMQINFVDLRTILGKTPIELTQIEIDEIKKIIKKYQIKIGCINSNLFKGPIIELSEKKEQMKERFIKYCEICKAFDTKILRVFPFRAPKKYKDLDPIPNEIISFYLELSDMAKPHEVIICTENENNLYANSPKHMLEFIEKTQRENVRLLFDPGNIFRHKPNFPVDRMDELYKYSGYAHFKDVAKNIFGGRFHVPIGEGFVGFKEIIKKMKSAGYSSLFAVETHMAKNKYENTKKSLHNLLELLKQLNWTI